MCPASFLAFVHSASRLLSHGPILIGTILNTVLYGISIAQTSSDRCPLSTYHRDKLWMKLIVLLVFVADTMNAVFDVEYTYNSLINHYNDPAAIQKANWALVDHRSPQSIVGTIVQLFFSWRVKVLTGSNIAVACLVVGSIISCLGGIATSIAIGIVPMWQEFQRFEIPVIIWLTISALVDSTITIIMVWHLRRHKRGFKVSDDILDKLIRLTVQTGMITSLWAIVDLVVFLAIPTGLHLIFNFPLGKLYSNSLLSSLNSRAGWKYNSNSEDISSMGGQLSRRPDMVTFGSVPIRPEVYIDVESHEMAHVDDKTDGKTLRSNGSSPDTTPRDAVASDKPRPSSVVMKSMPAAVTRS
ncbi:hypothetical protein K488DRAFT_40942 [Vararia minispora EC-137]|uniref:Uncharacterized protein n=1 Tax=Vararia minispora EC-137 TaxID=1314806 RepID=A0ACB8QXS1_9AGAM|nr:hypothetical protein K488DRAFT_40942 [Vararia minispora EC-137]